MACIKRQVSNVTKTQPGERDSDSLIADKKTHDHEDDSNSKMKKFIKEHFSKRCTQFIQTSEKDLFKCEYKREEHDAFGDAFGDVIFQDQGQKKAKYVRVHDTLNIEEHLSTLMYDHWKMKQPRLLISVIGGSSSYTTKNKQEDAKLREAFCKGLVQAAESTDAWIITYGTNEGVVKLVGKSLRRRKRRGLENLIAVGIASWQCIKNRESLLGDHVEPISLNSEQRTSSSTVAAKYEFANAEQSKMNSLEAKSGAKEFLLEPNHTHFIMVDDGKGQSYGGEINLRTRLEHKISERLATPVRVPIICIVLEGGKGTIDSARLAIEEGTPVLVMEGSGRAADILAEAYHLAKEYEDPKNIDWSGFEGVIQKKLSSEKKIPANVFSNVKEFVKGLHLITVFKFDDPDAAENIHGPIIDTLFKKNKDRMANLSLALAWNRIDIARELFPEDTSLSDDAPEEGTATKGQTNSGKGTNNAQSLEDMMFEAIVENKFNFVKFFLEKGVSLSEQLLSKVNPITIFYDRTKIQQKAPDEKEAKGVDKGKLASWPKDLLSELFDLVNDKFDAGQEHDDDVAMYLFYWSVINRLSEMATVFWSNAKEKLALALIGYLMFKKVEQKDNYLAKKDSLKKQTCSSYFEDLATGVLDECYSSDHQKTFDLLAREIDQFHGHTVLQIAVRVDSKKFLAHAACQDLLTKIWYRKFSKNNRPTKSGDTSNATESTEKNNDQPKRDLPAQDKSKTAGSSKLLGLLLSFVVAPVAKFRYNCLSYILLLLLYGLILVTDFHPTVSGKEIFLVFWVVTIVLEEGRQILTISSESFYGKLVRYMASTWNVLDCVTIVTFAVGFALRLIPTSNCFYAARIILALNFMMFFFRILHMFSIFAQLGPKLVMIGKMMIDLFYFMIILMIFIAAYGVASHAILYPNETLSISMIRDIFSGPWWSLYGEFNIGEVSGQECQPTDLQTMEAKQCASMEKHDLNRTFCPGKVEKCPANEWIGSLLLAFYALITNVMMINLLIAMFSNTFDKVEDMADEIWKRQRCHLVLEYESRPILPPPLIIAEHIILVIRKIQDRHSHPRSAGSICLSAESNVDPVDDNELKLEQDYQKDILEWLDVNAEEYLTKNETKNDDSSTDKTSDKMNKIIKKLNHLQRNFDKISKILKAKKEVHKE